MVPSSWPGRGFVTRPPCGISGRLLPVVALNSGLSLGGCCLSFVHSVFLCSLWLSLRTFQLWGRMQGRWHSTPRKATPTDRPTRLSRPAPRGALEKNRPRRARPSAGTRLVGPRSAARLCIYASINADNGLARCTSNAIMLLPDIRIALSGL